MIIGIEGTGSQDWGQPDLRRTFVRRILDQSGHAPKWYLIGPAADGLDGWAIINGGWIKILESNPSPLILVGYSRGAAYCMEIARKWGQRGGTVDVLVLFDAVARQADISLPEKVPANVKLCYHAYRNPAAGSRKFFENVGLHVESRQTKFEKKMFFGSHGAIGGTWYNAARDEGDGGNMFGDNVMGLGRLAGSLGIGSAMGDRQLVSAPSLPITNEQTDRAAANAVAAWMWPRLAAAGVVPGGAQNIYRTAPVFNGSRKAGVANYVQ
jgi:hypothetical protein